MFNIETNIYLCSMTRARRISRYDLYSFYEILLFYFVIGSRDTVCYVVTKYIELTKKVYSQ